VDPQKTTLGIPLLEGATSHEPNSRSIVIIIARNYLILRRVWMGKPISGLVVKTVTWEASSPFEFAAQWMGHTVHLVYFVYDVLHRNWYLKMSAGNNYSI
jgi:hypothetical protein